MRLIDGDALAMHMADWQLSACSDQHDTIEEAIDAVTSAPTIDAEPVIRCKDCKNWTEWENGAGSCQRSDSVMWLGTDATDFCSFAERKDNEID